MKDNKINWKQKLTSRKFWAAVAGFITPLLIALGKSSETATQVTAVIMSGGALIAYIIGEGLVDMVRNNNGDTPESTFEETLDVEEDEEDA